MVRGLDYSEGAISGKTIRAAGYGYVIRYVDDPGVVQLHTKHIKPGEYQDLIASGIDVWLVFEVAITDMLGGHNAGVANARRARTGADKIGYPPGRVIFMACDMHLTAAQIPVALGYIDGAISVLGNAATGVYGFSELLNACIAQDKGAAYWQPGHVPVPGSRVNVWQRNDGFTHVGGVQCDINELLIPIENTGEENELNADQAAMLIEIHDRVARIETAWDGGFTDDKENEYDLFMFVKRINVEVHQAWDAIRDVQEKIAALNSSASASGGALSDDDVQRIADKVAETLSQKPTS